MATSWQCPTTCLSTTTLSTAEGPADWSPASLWRILWNMPPRASKPLVPVRAGPPAGRWSSSLGRTFLTACRWCLAACWCGVSLHACNLTVSCCENLAKNINPSQVRELDLSNNNLTDAGITLLSKKLKNSKLEKLRLRSCNLTQHSSDDLTAVISSASCQLRELDLSDNDLQDVGVKTLSGGLESPHCQLKILSVSLCRVTEEGCTFLASALNSSSLRELDLSYNHPGELGVQLLSALMADPQCSLQKLSVEQCGESRIQPGPKKYTTKLTLDPNTAHRDHSLSGGDRKARRWTKQPYPDHPERFEFWTQVLCREELTGRCYWEPEWSGRAVTGVAYKKMCRTGEGRDSWLGKNDCSWAQSCTKDAYRTWHNDMSTAVTIPPNSNKVGVYLDWSAGKLSFFTVSCGTLTLLHTFHTTFTEPAQRSDLAGWTPRSTCARRSS
ncbi:uncharacterized protein LOC119197360 [Pungitius pungitius]|uniref:uncharacterized protein LOC119197360 n=1 Tax=Pungitius pungitius TaxID=134920 RepID=UPI002E138932